MDVDILDPAVQAAIVDLDERTVRFRHPLMRSAVRQGASVLQRRRVHEALADALQAEPDRGVWHRAALIAGTHEDVAAELEEAGRRARRRGAISLAATALRRAAELSDPAQRAGRLIAAAEQAGEAGDRDLHFGLLWLVATRAWWADPGPAARRTLVEAASRLGDTDDLHVLAIQAHADPFGHAPAVLARVQQAAAEGSHDTEALL